MRSFLVLLVMILSAGCSTHKSGMARHDRFDNVHVEQMVGNTVTDAILTKTVVCLNARRETRRIATTTNQTVTLLTNASVSVLTNLTIAVSTNFLVSAMTNQAPVLPASDPDAETPRPELANPAETNLSSLATALNAQSVTTNVTVSLAQNQSTIRSPNQAGSNLQLIRTLNQQFNVVSNNLSISLVTNQITTLETNQVLHYHTNISITAVTNTIVTPTNRVCHDYYLFTELLTPPDFSLQGGESLVLLVDGMRHGFSPTPSHTAFVGRKGFTTTLYGANAEVLVDIANAREVRIRIKGVNATIERTMNRASKQHFREFLLRHFQDREPADEVAALTAPAVGETLTARRKEIDGRPRPSQRPIAPALLAELR